MGLRLYDLTGSDCFDNLSMIVEYALLLAGYRETEAAHAVEIAAALSDEVPEISNAGHRVHFRMKLGIQARKLIQQEIVDYLGKGRNQYAAVGGEMTSVIENSTSHMSNADLNAIAAYLKTLPATEAVVAVNVDGRKSTTAKLSAAKDLTAGEKLYLNNCGACHFVTGKGAPNVFPQLDGAAIVNAESPVGLIHTILAGAQTPSTSRAPSAIPMPAFSARLSDQDVAELATFVRNGWSNSAPGVTVQDVRAVRKTIPQAAPITVEGQLRQ